MPGPYHTSQDAQHEERVSTITMTSGCSAAQCGRRLVSESLRDGQREAAARALSCSLMVALTLGVSITVLYQGTALQLVKLTGCAPELWAPALTYLRVRAIAAPANLVTMVAQSGGLCWGHTAPC